MIPDWKDYPPSKVQSDDWEKAKSSFFDWAISIAPYYSDEKSREFDILIENLSSNGWYRGDIYAVIEDCLCTEEYTKKMTEFQIDVLGDFLHDMCGLRPPSIIESILPDPVDLDIDPNKYGMIWRRGGPKTSGTRRRH